MFLRIPRFKGIRIASLQLRLHAPGNHWYPSTAQIFVLAYTNTRIIRLWTPLF